MVRGATNGCRDTSESDDWIRVRNRLRHKISVEMKMARGPATVNIVGRYRHTVDLSLCGSPLEAIDDWAQADPRIGVGSSIRYTASSSSTVSII